MLAANAEETEFCTVHLKLGKQVPVLRDGLCRQCFQTAGDAFIAPLLPQSPREDEPDSPATKKSPRRVK